MKKIQITQSKLKKLLEYNPDTGVFIWKRQIGRKIRPGDMAGTVGSHGYRVIRINGIGHREHRLAWLYVYGKFSNDCIDHINRDKTDNRITNLRDVTQSENCRNVKRKTGLGVYLCKNRKKKWRVVITINTKIINIGYFYNKEDAKIARGNAEIKYGFNKNNINNVPCLDS